MSMKQVILTGIVAFSFVSTAFAKVNDWAGEFNVKTLNNQIVNLKHTSNSVSYDGLLNSIHFLKFLKGTSYNGTSFQSDVVLAVEVNVDTFTEEATKIGTIVDKKIVLGPNYTVK